MTRDGSDDWHTVFSIETGPSVSVTRQIFWVMLMSAGLFIITITLLSAILPFPASAIGAWVVTVTGTGIATM